MTDVKFPKYKEDVLVVTRAMDDGQCRGKDYAMKRGYNFYTYEIYPNELYYVTEDCKWGLTGYADCVLYRYLPSKKDLEMANDTTIEDKVLEFVRDPARSNANDLMKTLAEYGFFGPGTESQKRSIIKTILKSNPQGWCRSGIAKFEDHMGDLLGPEKERVITLDIVVPLDTGNHSFYPASSVVGDIQFNYIAQLPRLSKNNFYHDAKVKLVSDTHRDKSS